VDVTVPGIGAILLKVPIDPSRTKGGDSRRGAVRSRADREED
jgi:hypothetical protein